MDGGKDIYVGFWEKLARINSDKYVVCSNDYLRDKNYAINDLNRIRRGMYESNKKMQEQIKATQSSLDRKIDAYRKSHTDLSRKADKLHDSLFYLFQKNVKDRLLDYFSDIQLANWDRDNDLVLYTDSMEVVECQIGYNVVKDALPYSEFTTVVQNNRGTSIAIRIINGCDTVFMEFGCSEHYGKTHKNSKYVTKEEIRDILNLFLG